MISLSNLLAKRLTDTSLNTCSRWAEHRVQMPLPLKGPMRFDRFPFQKSILDIEEGQVSVLKSAQMGFSIAGIVRTLYVIAEKGADCLVVLPTQALAGDFAKGRLDSIVAISPDLQDVFQRGSDSVGLKKTKKHATLYIRGSVSQRGLVSVPIGTAIVDELDRCERGTLDLVRERLSGQIIKYLFTLSTPTLPDFGIHKEYLQGTQELFMFQCLSCGKHDHLRWPDSVVVCGEGHQDPRCAESYYKCTHCHARLPHESKQEWLSAATWQAQVKVPDHRSFSINQLYSTTVTPEEFVRASHKAQLSDAAAVEFANQKTGQPFLLANSRLTDTTINSCRKSFSIHDPRPQDCSELITMGIDVGSWLDVCVTKYTFPTDPGREPYINSRAKLLHTCRVPSHDWGQLDRMMAEWQVRHACIDFQPETNLAKAFARRFHGFASLVQYRRGTVGNEIKENLDENFVPTLTVDRTSFLDFALNRFYKGTIEIPYDCGEVFYEHLKALARTYEEVDGDTKSVYVALADDHQAHAMAYCEVAMLRAFKKSTGREISP
jgi:hypothetical protein